MGIKGSSPPPLPLILALKKDWILLSPSPINGGAGRNGGEMLPLDQEEAGARVEVKAAGEKEEERHAGSHQVRPLETCNGASFGRRQSGGPSPALRGEKCFYCLASGCSSPVP